jgi:hydroxypyruvate reductase
VQKYQIETRIPETARLLLESGLRGEVEETVKPGHPALALTENILIGTNTVALTAAAVEARRRGYQVITLSSRIVGEAREVAKVLAGIAIDCAVQSTIASPPVCILSGGEPVVQIRGKGKGGRNQEMALAYLMEMERHHSLCEQVSFLAASTDGNDGPTDAAGAFADLELLERARSKQLDLGAYLNNNDSYHFYDRIDGLLKTGPTNTNVCDLHAALVVSRKPA